MLNCESELYNYCGFGMWDFGSVTSLIQWLLHVETWYHECLSYGLSTPTFNYDFASVTLEIKQKEIIVSEKMSEKVLKLINHNPLVITIALAKQLEKSPRLLKELLKA